MVQPCRWKGLYVMTQFAQWQPTQGHIRRKGNYTIRKPRYLIKDSQGRIVGAIAEWGADSGAIQFGTDKPTRIIGSCYYELTGYGKGTDSGGRGFLSALSYCQGPDSPLLTEFLTVEKI